MKRTKVSEPLSGLATHISAHWLNQTLKPLSFGLIGTQRGLVLLKRLFRQHKLVL